ncbi:CarD family transcriptional regulator [Bacillus sp. AFS076308]|uniref:CarD family transcriptional regulator n=1 Tax=unclassified Bacillus (in: firmicutes) TaxID=185979 RepID=UPI000BF598D6|nr:MULTISPECIES: CarD family transcriptional regulator [unclassified Bacillus (in: firmicutes)]PFO08389.1 CarD family transcriptional regulator [Bacillus sp. AFS076308]PGV50602.1 CarD family transcriptional regulator [Bacillus sp. AFS037270]
MFSIGDLIVYSGHGICRIDEICDKTYSGITRAYYVLHPIENSHDLTISTPVDNDKTVILKLMNKEEAEKIVDSFHSAGINWIERPQLRGQVYKDIVKTGNRMDIANVVNTLLRKKYEYKMAGKKFYEHDNKILSNIQTILFKELSIALNTSPEVIFEKINSMIESTDQTPIQFN